MEKGAGALAAILHLAAIPHMLLAAPFVSPRLMGEAAYGLGRMSAGVPGISGLLVQQPRLCGAIKSGLLSSAVRAPGAPLQAIPQSAVFAQ